MKTTSTAIIYYSNINNSKKQLQDNGFLSTNVGIMLAKVSVIVTGILL